MRSHQSILRSNRICGSFFLFLGALSAVLSCFAFRAGDWWLAALLLFGVCFSGFVGWIAVTSTAPLTQTGGSSGGRGFSEAGKPVPVRPAPTHHLTAAKDLPPSDKTHSLPKD